MLSMLRDVLLDAVTEAGGTVGLLQLRAHLDQVRVHARAVHMHMQCTCTCTCSAHARAHAHARAMHMGGL